MDVERHILVTLTDWFSIKQDKFGVELETAYTISSTDCRWVKDREFPGNRLAAAPAPQM